MSAPPLSPVARRALLATSISALGNGFTLPFLLVYLHTVRGIPLSVTGVVIATIGAAGLAFSPLVGTAIDRFGARLVQLVSVVVLTVGTVYLSRVDSTAAAFAAAAVIGAGQAASWPSMNALLASVSGPEQRQRLFAIEFTLINAGIGLGGIVGGLLADVHRPGTFELLYQLDAATYVLAGVVLLTLRGAGGPVAKPVDAAGNSTDGGWGEVLRDRTMRWLCLLFADRGHGRVRADRLRVPGVRHRGRRRLHPGAGLRVRGEHGGDRARPAARAAPDGGDAAGPGRSPVSARSSGCPGRCSG